MRGVYLAVTYYIYIFTLVKFVSRVRRTILRSINQYFGIPPRCQMFTTGSLRLYGGGSVTTCILCVKWLRPCAIVFRQAMRLPGA